MNNAIAVKGDINSSLNPLIAMNKVCFLCLNPSRLKCSRCLTIQYCSKECQKKDWKVHRNNCEDCNYDNNMDHLRRKASNYMLQGNYLKAEKAYLRLLVMVEEQLTDQEVDKIGVLNCLSEAYRRQGEKKGREGGKDEVEGEREREWVKI